MTKETKEERELRRAAEAHSALIARQAFLADLPRRMLEVQARANKAGFYTEVTLTSTGADLRIYEQGEGFFDEHVNSSVDEWQLEYVERHVREKMEEIDARMRRHALATETWKTLTDSEKEALKEHIRNMV